MSYVHTNLMPNEQIITNAKIHWFMHFPGFIES